MSDTMEARSLRDSGLDPRKFRVAAGPIKRKPRSPSTKPQPKPQFADAVWYSFDNGQPLELSVRTTAVADTVRKLKRAARYLDRTTPGKEVRVQISVEAHTEDEIAADAKLAKQSKVKFLGHEPWLLGRRISKTEAEAREAGRQAAEDVIAAREPAPPEPGKHRRTVAGRRPKHAALRRAVVRAVITAATAPVHLTIVHGGGCFSWSDMVAKSLVYL